MTTREHGAIDPAARERLRQANDQILAAHARARDFEERYEALQLQVVRRAADLAAAEARADAAELRLRETLKVLGPPLAARLRR